MLDFKFHASFFRQRCHAIVLVNCLVGHLWNLRSPSGGLHCVTKMVINLEITMASWLISN